MCKSKHILSWRNIGISVAVAFILLQQEGILRAQMLEVQDSITPTSRQEAIMYEQFDFNQVRCALLILHFNDNEMTFEGDIRTQEFRNGEWWIWMSNGANWLTIKSKHYTPLRIVFNPMQSGKTYEMTLRSIGKLMLAIGDSIHADPFMTDASKTSLKDAQGRTCALMRIGLVLPYTKFEGNGVVYSEYRDGEWWVWLSPEATQMTISAEGYLPLTIEFEPAQASTTYLMTIIKVEQDEQQKQQVQPKVFNHQKVSVSRTKEDTRTVLYAIMDSLFFKSLDWERTWGFNLSYNMSQEYLCDFSLFFIPDFGGGKYYHGFGFGLPRQFSRERYKGFSPDSVATSVTIINGDTTSIEYLPFNHDTTIMDYSYGYFYYEPGYNVSRYLTVSCKIGLSLAWSTKTISGMPAYTTQTTIVNSSSSSSSSSFHTENYSATPDITETKFDGVGLMIGPSIIGHIPFSDYIRIVLNVGYNNFFLSEKMKSANGFNIGLGFEFYWD